MKDLRIRHGLCKHPMYRAWASMRDRCRNPNTASYKNYGARGISVCERWEDFSLFLADMGERPPGKTLERIDNAGPYSQENCRWASYMEQGRNKRSNVLVTYGEKTMSAAEWAQELGIPRTTIIRRIRDGKAPAEILGFVKIVPGIEIARQAMLRDKRALTHCKHGHEFTPENTVIFKSGTRHCKECNRTRAREFYRKKAGTKGRT